MPHGLNRRDVVRTVFEGGRPPYVPWQFAFTAGAREKLVAHCGTDDLEAAVGNHMLMLKRSTGMFTDLGCDMVQDAFGVVWDRTLDADIGFPDKRRPAAADPPRAGAARPARSALLSRVGCARLGPAATGSPCSQQASRCTSGRGRCAASRT